MEETFQRFKSKFEGALNRKLTEKEILFVKWLVSHQ